jgi:predicted amidophosphoribosyltransferase
MTIDGLRKGISIGVGAMSHLLWPKRCVNCGQVIFDRGSDLCGLCGQEIGFASGSGYCRRCGRDVSEYAIVQGCCPVCSEEEILFDGIARGGDIRRVFAGIDTFI